MWHNLTMDFQAIRRRIDEVIAHRPGANYRNISLKSGMSDSALHKFMTGAVATMRMNKLANVAAALDVDVRYLAFGEESFDIVSQVWEAIPADRRDQAIQVLLTFADDDDDLASKVAEFRREFVHHPGLKEREKPQ